MKHLKIGDQAPIFKTEDQEGNKIDSTLFEGKKWVLYFYPKDMTPGCTVQACNIRDNYETLKKEGIEIIGVSMDSVARHQNFTSKFDLPFPLVADENKELIELYGVWGEKKFMGKIYDGIHRITFLIDGKNSIVGIIEKPKTKYHSEEILEIFKKNN
jgi:peroxiredoxin Q/BCP